MTARQSRETRLYLDAVVRMLGQEEVERNIGGWQFENETPVDMLDNRKELPAQAFQAIRALWPGQGKLVTLEDLASSAREEIAGLPNVGPKAMVMLDAAMVEHGLMSATATGCFESERDMARRCAAFLEEEAAELPVDSQRN